MNLGLAVSAQLSSGMGLSARAARSKAIQSLLEGIRRQPLAMGFQCGENEFGWVLGPRFGIKDGKRTSTQAAQSRSLTATICAPSWWSGMEVKAQAYKIGGDGVLTEYGGSRNFTVPLETDMECLVEAVLKSKGLHLKLPQILIPQDRFTVWSGVDKQGLVINGVNLWRNPQVYVENTKAANVTLMPGLEGLYASFDTEIPMPPDGRADLTVVTGDGARRLPDIVDVVSKTAQGVAPFLTLADSKLIWENNKDKTLTAKVNAKNQPVLAPDLRIYIYTKGKEMDRIPLEYNKSASTSKEYVWNMPEAFKPQSKFYKLCVDVRAWRALDDVVGVSVLDGAQSLVFFEKEEDSQLRFKDAKLELSRSSNAAITIQTPFSGDKNKTKLFFEAYPGLKGMDEDFLTLELTLPGSAAKKPAAVLEKPTPDYSKGTFVFKTTLDNLEGLKLSAGTPKKVEACLVYGPKSAQKKLKVSNLLEINIKKAKE